MRICDICKQEDKDGMDRFRFIMQATNDRVSQLQEEHDICSKCTVKIVEKGFLFPIKDYINKAHIPRGHGHI